MPRLFETTVADATKYREELLQQISGAKMGTHWDLNYQVLLDFKAALAAKSEEAIQLVLTANPYLIQYALPQSGHHGILRSFRFQSCQVRRDHRVLRSLVSPWRVNWT